MDPQTLITVVGIIAATLTPFVLHSLATNRHLRTEAAAERKALDEKLRAAHKELDEKTERARQTLEARTREERKDLEDKLSQSRGEIFGRLTAIEKEMAAVGAKMESHIDTDDTFHAGINDTLKSLRQDFSELLSVVNSIKVDIATAKGA